MPFTEKSCKDKTFTVYEHYNKVNGKRYIGITSQEPDQRWRNGEGYKTNPYFYSSIKKHGWDSFNHIILFQELSFQEACLKEQELIKKYNTQNPKKGYNLTVGGDASPMLGKRHTEESNRKNRIAHLGKKISEETREKYRERTAQWWATATEEQKRNRLKNFIGTGAASQKGKVGRGAKKVICLENGKIFESSADAAKWIGVLDSSNIRACCRGKHKKVYGYHWKWLEDYRKKEDDA